MIADLVGTMNNLEQTHKHVTYRSVLFPAPAFKPTRYQCDALVMVRKTYVYHESTRATPSHSILLTYHFEEPIGGSIMPSIQNEDVVR